jgi:hypothetical protein
MMIERCPQSGRRCIRTPQIHKSIGAGEQHSHFEKSKKPQISPSFELSIDGGWLQWAMGKSHNQQIISFFQLVIRLI